MVYSQVSSPENMGPYNHTLSFEMLLGDHP
jgi:hypothetical protein